MPSGAARCRPSPETTSSPTPSMSIRKRRPATSIPCSNTLIALPLERAVQALSDARTVLVVGMHAWHSAATYLHHLGITAFGNWHQLVPGSAEFARQLGALAPEDAVVCIAIEPCAADSIRVAQRAREAGARVIGITDRLTSPLAGVLRRQSAHFGRKPEHFPVPCRRDCPRRGAGGHGRRAKRTVGDRERRVVGTFAPRHGGILDRLIHLIVRFRLPRIPVQPAHLPQSLVLRRRRPNLRWRDARARDTMAARRPGRETQR